jgi:hypothetical protein
MADMDPAQGLGKCETAGVAEAAGNFRWAEWAFIKGVDFWMGTT